jgi:Zn-dependent M28 family amino/carboxypeptidase
VRAARFAALLALAFCAVAGQAPRHSALLDSAALLRDVQVLSADAMEGRRADTPGGARARAYVLERFKAAGLRPVGGAFEHPFTFTSGRSGSATRNGVNVLGLVDGTADASRYLVVSAHYDHLGVQAGRVFNGADDNASGTAALFALAEHFRGRRPRHSIIFAAFDAEESGLRGARAFVASPPVERAAVVINVNIDQIGRDTAHRLFAVGTFLQPFLKPYVERVARTAPVKLLMGHDDPNEPTMQDWTRDSDHWAFLEAGIPAIYLGDENYEHLHRPSDDFETLIPEFLIGAAETCLALIRELDEHLPEIQAATARRAG